MAITHLGLTSVVVSIIEYVTHLGLSSVVQCQLLIVQRTTHFNLSVSHAARSIVVVHKRESPCLASFLRDNTRAFYTINGHDNATGTVHIVEFREQTLF